MTRKDYVAIAAALKAAALSLPHFKVKDGSIVHQNRDVQLAWFACVTEITAVLSRENSRFDASRFHDECGVPS
jgi:hypothetical protein